MEWPAFLRLRASMMSANAAIDVRRLDESIQAELQLQGQLQILQTDERRLQAELETIGRPTGVVSAVVILAVYSCLGILAPVIVMALEPQRLSVLSKTLLVGAFIVGLVAVLAYIVWYARTLDDTVEPELPGHESD